MKRFSVSVAAMALAMQATLPAVAQDSGPEIGEARFEGGSIVFDNVRAESPGYLVVTENVPEDAPASQPVAIAEVEPGDNRDLVIQGDFSHGGDFVIMLYEESGDQEGFQWREGVADLPVTDDGEHVTTTFQMMMEAGDEDA